MCDLEGTRECGLPSWAERCHIVPSPLVGEGQGEGYNNAATIRLVSLKAVSRRCRIGTGLAFRVRRHPSPCPSPTRGEGTMWRAPSRLTQGTELLQRRLATGVLLGELDLGHRDQHVGAGPEVGRLEQRLLLGCPIWRHHRERVDQRLVGSVLDAIPVRFEVV